MTPTDLPFLLRLSEESDLFLKQLVQCWFFCLLPVCFCLNIWCVEGLARLGTVLFTGSAVLHFPAAVRNALTVRYYEHGVMSHGRTGQHLAMLILDF